MATVSKGSFLSQNDDAWCLARSMKKCFPNVVLKNLTGLHRTLTLTPSNTFGTNLKVAQNHYNLTDALVTQWDQIPCSLHQKSCIKPYHKSERLS